MSSEIPTLGFKSRTEAIRAMAEQGFSHGQIAKAAEIEPRLVRHVLEVVPEPKAKAKVSDPRKPHREVVDPNKIVSGVLAKSVRSLREARPASPESWGRTIQSLQQTRFRLQRDDGHYLRLDTEGFIADRAYAWIGFAHQLQALLKKRPDLAALTVERVPPQSRGAYREALLIR